LRTSLRTSSSTSSSTSSRSSSCFPSSFTYFYNPLSWHRYVGSTNAFCHSPHNIKDPRIYLSQLWSSLLPINIYLYANLRVLTIEEHLFFVSVDQSNPM
jgi:hypothetical protein